MSFHTDPDLDQVSSPARRNRRRQMIDPLVVHFKEQQIAMGSVVATFTHGPPVWLERDLRCGQNLVVAVGADKTKLTFREVEAQVAANHLEPAIERIMRAWLDAVRTAAPYTLKELVADRGIVEVSTVLEVEYPSLRHRMAGRVSMSVDELYTLHLQYPQMDLLATAKDIYLMRHAVNALAKSKGKR